MRFNEQDRCLEALGTEVHRTIDVQKHLDEQGFRMPDGFPKESQVPYTGYFALEQTVHGLHIIRAHAVLAARHADVVYWVGRSMEELALEGSVTALEDCTRTVTTGRVALLQAFEMASDRDVAMEIAEARLPAAII